MSERDSHRQSHTAEEKMIADKIQKLSQLLELDEDSFAEQFADFHPIAQHKFESAGLEPLMAWKAALSLALKDSNLRNHHPQGELRKALSSRFWIGLFYIWRGTSFLWHPGSYQQQRQHD